MQETPPAEPTDPVTMQPSVTKYGLWAGGYVAPFFSGITGGIGYYLSGQTAGWVADKHQEQWFVKSGWEAVNGIQIMGNKIFGIFMI